MFPYGLEGERLIDFFDAAPVFNELVEEFLVMLSPSELECWAEPKIE